MRTQTPHRTFVSSVTLFAVVATMTFMAGRASAVVTELALWKLGEPGTFVGGLPQDSVGGHHFLNPFGTQTVITPGAPISSSTAATSYAGNGGSYFAAAGTTVIPNDNFALELWARNDNPNQLFTDLFTTGPGIAPAYDGSLRIHSDPSGNWAASLFGVNWIGAPGGAGQPITANEWTHLAVIRDAGISTFYINGIAQAGTLATAPLVNVAGFHVGVSPGGATAFAGDIDEVRIFSFDPNTDNPVAALSINAIPEPATATLAVLTMLAGSMWRGRRSA